jgi:DNA-binding transcriptional LysR family regulator
MAIDDFKWDHWRSVLAVMRYGSLSAAARATRVTQPTIGRHVESLEATLGSALFIRTSTGLLPTALATALAPFLEDMAASAKTLERTANASLFEDAGTVRLSTSLMMGTERLPPLLRAFRQAYPRISVELALTDAQVDLARMEADVALRMVEPSDSTLLAERIGEVPLGLYAHSDYVTKNGLPQNESELFDHDLIGTDQDDAVLDRYLIAGRRLNKSMFSFRCDNEIGRLAALRAGFGIGMCQKAIANRDSELLPVLPDRITFSMDMWLVTHVSLKGVRRVRSLWDFLSEHLRHG